MNRQVAGRRLPDYYAALGVQHDATGMEIERAYWKLAYESPSADDLRLLNQAFEVLGHKERRKEYDARRAQGAVEAPRREWTPRPGGGVTERLRNRWNFR